MLAAMTQDDPLSDLRVLELGEMVAAPYLTKLLADSGADVIKLEPPGRGDPSRQRGPFPDGRPDPERSGLFLYLNTNKRSVTLDLSDDRGRALFHQLVERADVLATNLPAARLEAWNLSPAELRTRYPQLIVTTVTPLGLGGPRGSWAADELVTYAMGGLAASSPGIPDAIEDPELEPPLHPDCFIAETVAGVVAAVATMAAVFQRAFTGQGSHLDVSEQAALISMDRRSSSALAYSASLPGRMPTSVGAAPNCYLPCKDGYVVIAAFLGHHWERLVDVMGNPEWAMSDLFRESKGRGEHWDALKLLLLEWTMQYTGDELYRIGEDNGFPLFPFYSVSEIVESDHARARGSFVGLGEGDHRFQAPGPAVHLADSPWRLRRAAPKLGQDTMEILQQDLNCDEGTVQQLLAAGVI